MTAFSAVSVCPRCDAADLHRLRAPDPARTGALRTLRSTETGETHTLHVWGGGLDERQHEAIRTCVSCGHVWGQS